MENNKLLAQQLIRFRILSRKAMRCEEGPKQVISLRTKFLFLLSDVDTLTPNQIMSELLINKSNLALLAKTMLKDGLISARKDIKDRRSVFYGITEKGREFLAKRLARIAETYKGVFNGDSYQETVGKMDEILHALSFLNIM